MTYDYFAAAFGEALIRELQLPATIYGRPVVVEAQHDAQRLAGRITATDAAIAKLRSEIASGATEYVYALFRDGCYSAKARSGQWTSFGSRDATPEAVRAMVPHVDIGAQVITAQQCGLLFAANQLSGEVRRFDTRELYVKTRSGTTYRVQEK